MTRNITMTLSFGMSTLIALGALIAAATASHAAGVYTAQPVRIRTEYPAPPATVPSATYTTRGEIVELPLADKPATELRLRHEAIDDFQNPTGKVVGMNTMIMEFPPAKGVSLAGLKVGDKVAATFSIWWDQSPPWLATKIVKLPADTQLEFRRARKPGDAAVPDFGTELTEVRAAFERTFGKDLVDYTQKPGKSIGNVKVWSVRAGRPARPQSPVPPSSPVATAVSAEITESGIVLRSTEELTELPAELLAAAKTAVAAEVTAASSNAVKLGEIQVWRSISFIARATVGDEYFKVVINEHGLSVTPMPKPETKPDGAPDSEPDGKPDRK